MPEATILDDTFMRNTAFMSEIMIEELQDLAENGIRSELITSIKDAGVKDHLNVKLGDLSALLDPVLEERTDAAIKAEVLLWTIVLA
ncbi:MAG: hypothetical protein Q9157_007019 [Trypethelium eluteriae]